MFQFLELLWLVTEDILRCYDYHKIFTDKNICKLRPWKGI